MRGFFLIFFICVPALVWSQHYISTDTHQIDGTGNYSHIQPGDTVYLTSGERSQLLIQNLNGTADKPVVFMPANKDLPVIITGEGSYGVSIRSSSYIRLSGYQGVEGQQGIRIENLLHPYSVGVSLSDKSTDIEIDHIHIRVVGFAGILAKTDPICGDPSTQRGGFIQRNTRIHHCWIQHTGGEGIYIGNTGFLGIELSCGLVFPGVLEGVHVYNNRVEQTGWDGIQVSSAVSDCLIYDNELDDCSVGLSPGQMSGIIIGGGTLADCYNNKITDCRGTGILVFGNGGSRVFNNVIIRPGRLYAPQEPDLREHGIYIHDKTLVDKSFYGIFSNTIIQPKSDAIRISGEVNFDVRIFNNALIDPGAWDIYDNDNTSREGDEAFVFVETATTRVLLEGNAFLRTVGEALFFRPDQDDYHLQKSSPLVDHGVDLQKQMGIHFDFDNNPRPSGLSWDIGAFEYVESSYVAQRPLEASLVDIHLLSGSEGSGRLVFDVLQPSSFSWRVVSMNGHVIEYNPLSHFETGRHEVLLPNGLKGVYLVQIIGAGWSVSEKVLIL